MDVIVLMKLVADIDHIPPDAWDRETGTLRRGRLRMVSNPLDDRALRAATELARARGGRVFVLSMGPRAAEHACRRAIAYGADEAILLSDSAFAGADTLATARVLAAAIRRIMHDHDIVAPAVFAGMQSPDGDTAQVPAAVAALLGFPLLPYVSAFRIGSTDGSAEIELLRRRGRVHATIVGGPLVLTFTGLAAQLPFATSLAGMIRGSQTRVERVTAAELGIDASSTGLAGSATRVVKIETIAHTVGHGCAINLQANTNSREAVGELVRRVADDLAEVAGSRQNSDIRTTRDLGVVGERARATASEGHTTASSPAARGAIWTYVERDEQGSLEILGEARRLADTMRVPSIALVCGSEPNDEMMHTLSVHGATSILVLRTDSETGTGVTAWSQAVTGSPLAAGNQADTMNALTGLLLHHRDAALIATAARIHRPRTILIAATLLGRTVSALAAALLGAGLTADCTGLRLEEWDSEPERGPGPPLLQIRPALGGNILATIVSTARSIGLPEMATVRSGVFPLRLYDGQNRSPVELFDARTVSPAEAEQMRASAQAITDVTVEPGGARGTSGVDPEANVVVAVGAGIGSAELLARYVTPLVGAIARAWKVTTSLACSRAVVDAGILPYEYQIGQTGKSVRPALYVALGISGAIQHRLGMEHSARVLSVNPDPEAPIHALSDYSIVGTIEEAVPLLLQALEPGGRSAQSTG